MPHGMYARDFQASGKRPHLSLHVCERLAEASELIMAVRVVPEEPVEEPEAIGARSLHQFENVGEAIGVDRSS